jgi:hypothetical protein
MFSTVCSHMNIPKQETVPPLLLVEVYGSSPTRKYEHQHRKDRIHQQRAFKSANLDLQVHDTQRKVNNQYMVVLGFRYGAQKLSQTYSSIEQCWLARSIYTAPSVGNRSSLLGHLAGMVGGRWVTEELTPED